jgi:AcrR family transcriptional regulator
VDEAGRLIAATGPAPASPPRVASRARAREARPADPPERRMGRAPILPDPVEDRLYEALVELVAEHGFSGLRLKPLLRRASVDRDDFEARYEDVEDCVLAIYESSVAVFLRGVLEAYDAEDHWRDGLRSAAYAAAGWIADHPGETRFAMVDVLQAEGEMLRVRREEIIQACAKLLDTARVGAADPDAIPTSAPVVVIGSVAEMLTRTINRGSQLEPVAVVPQLMYLALRPYVGEESARAELLIPPPR